jgi:hypothetical protein
VSGAKRHEDAALVSLSGIRGQGLGIKKTRTTKNTKSTNGLCLNSRKGAKNKRTTSLRAKRSNPESWWILRLRFASRIMTALFFAASREDAFLMPIPLLLIPDL